MNEIKLKKIHDVIDCMNDIGMLDSYWEESIRVDIYDSLDYMTMSKNVEERRQAVKLNSLLKEIEDLKTKE